MPPAGRPRCLSGPRTCNLRTSTFGEQSNPSAEVRHPHLINPPGRLLEAKQLRSSYREATYLMTRVTRGWATPLIVALALAAGCSRSPEAQKTRYLERGDKYASREQY